MPIASDIASVENTHPTSATIAIPPTNAPIPSNRYARIIDSDGRYPSRLITGNSQPEINPTGSMSIIAIKAAVLMGTVSQIMSPIINGEKRRATILAGSKITPITNSGADFTLMR